MSSNLVGEITWTVTFAITAQNSDRRFTLPKEVRDALGLADQVPFSVAIRDKNGNVATGVLKPTSGGEVDIPHNSAFAPVVSPGAVLFVTIFHTN
jgi:hypothetical protein